MSFMFGKGSFTKEEEKRKKEVTMFAFEFTQFWNQTFHKETGSSQTILHPIKQGQKQYFSLWLHKSNFPDFSLILPH